MGRGSLFLLYCAMALGQAPPMDPFERAMQASQQARNQGNPAETAARREEAHKLLDQMPADSQQWAGRVQRLAQSYQGAGWHVRARAVVQDALGRAAAFPEWHPARVQLLNMLAGFWEQDGNLLKALSYREKAILAVEATPPGASAEGQSSGLTKGVILAGDFGSARMVNGLFNPGRARGNDNYLYDQLASLYRRLGRPEEAAKTIAKMRSRMQNDAGALANSYAEEGDFDQAVALYRKQAEAAAAKPQAQPWEIAGPLQSIASLYEQQERWTDAAAALQQAATRLDSSGEPAARNSANSIRLRLASLLVRSGQRQSAEDLYQSLLHLTANDHPDQALPVIQRYADYLAETGRYDQGVQLLKDFQASHSDLQPWQESNILMSLAQIARNHGEKDLADQYQQAAMEKQRTGTAPQTSPRQVIGPEMQQAQKAVSEGNLDEAVNLTLDAIESASTAPDGEQIAWQAPNVAAQLAGRKAAEKGEQIFRALFPVLEARAVDNPGALNQALQQYARFLIGRKDRAGDAALAIDRYRDGVAASLGPESDG